MRKATACSVKIAADPETVTEAIGETGEAGVMPNVIGLTDKTDQGVETGRIGSIVLTKQIVSSAPTASNALIK